LKLNEINQEQTSKLQCEQWSYVLNVLSEKMEVLELLKSGPFDLQNQLFSFNQLFSSVIIVFNSFKIHAA
jgi:hypothetical protein